MDMLKTPLQLKEIFLCSLFSHSLCIQFFYLDGDGVVVVSLLLFIVSNISVYGKSSHKGRLNC